MLEEITIYSKPINKYNLKGRFYSIYLTKNTNLDLTNLNKKNQPNPKSSSNDIKDFILKQQSILKKLENIISEQKELLNKETSKLLTKGD